MYCDDPGVLEPPYCDVPTKLGVVLAYCDSGVGSWIAGACGPGPESAAREAEREPESPLAMLELRRWPRSCAAYSGPRYCDNRTVLRFS